MSSTDWIEGDGYESILAGPSSDRFYIYVKKQYDLKTRKQRIKFKIGNGPWQLSSARSLPVLKHQLEFFVKITEERLNTLVEIVLAINNYQEDINAVATAN